MKGQYILVLFYVYRLLIDFFMKIYLALFIVHGDDMLFVDFLFTSLNFVVSFVVIDLC